MADTPNPGETVTNGQLKNDATSTSTTDNGNADASAVENLRKELEQSKIRANQLENEKRKLQEEDEKRKQKELEDKEEWKTIAERERERRETLERERAEAETKARLQQAHSSVLEEFPPEVVEVANETGLTLSDDSDESKEKLRSTLTKLSERMGVNKKPSPNNPGTSSKTSQSRQELIQEYVTNGTPSSLDKAVGELNWIKSSKQQYGG